MSDKRIYVVKNTAGGLDADGQPAPQFNLKYRLTRATNEMLGLCRGLLADGQLVDTEIKCLQDWVEANAEAASVFPVKNVAERLKRIFADGVVSEHERQDLKELLEQTIGPPPADTMDQSSTSLPLDDPAPEIVFPTMRFSFTGKFASGTRSWCVGQVEQLGGAFDRSPIRGTNFLVIGTFGSRDWAHSSFGRKIEAAVKLKPGLKLVAEEHWFKFLPDQQADSSSG